MADSEEPPTLGVKRRRQEQHTERSAKRARASASEDAVEDAAVQSLRWRDDVMPMSAGASEGRTGELADSAARSLLWARGVVAPELHEEVKDCEDLLGKFGEDEVAAAIRDDLQTFKDSVEKEANSITSDKEQVDNEALQIAKEEAAIDSTTLTNDDLLALLKHERRKSQHERRKSQLQYRMSQLKDRTTVMVMTLKKRLEAAMKTRQERDGDDASRTRNGRLLVTLDNAYVDNVNVVTNFERYVWGCARKVHGLAARLERCHAVVPLVQSSGFGKTRLCKELLLRNSGVYWCLRPRDTSGYPFGSARFRAALDDEFGNGGDGAETIARGICLFVRYMREKEHVQTYEQLLKHRDQAGIRQRWWQAHVKLEEARVVHDPKEVGGGFAAVQEEIGAFFKGTDAIEHRQRMFVVVVDEGRHLVEQGQYRAFRRGVNSVASMLRNSGLFVICVIADTLSKVANFAAPERLRDASHRASEEEGAKRIFRPWLWLQCDVPIADIPEVYPEKWISYGRPLWSTTYQCNTQRGRMDKLNKLVGFAAEKLTNNRRTDAQCARHSGGKWQDSCKWMALLLARVYCVVGSGSVAAEYVSRYMGTALSVSDDREGLKVGTCPEPMLAIAAYRYWEEDESMRQILQSAVEMHVWQHIEMGERGETAAQVALARAFKFRFKFSLETPLPIDVRLHDMVMPVEEYLSNLGFEVNEALKRESEVYRSGVVCVLQFCRCHRSSEMEIAVRMASERGCGVVAPPNYKGLDMIIPVYDGQVAKEKEELAVVSLLLVQVKNRIQATCSFTTKDTGATLKLSPEFSLRAASGGVKSERIVPDVGKEKDTRDAGGASDGDGDVDLDGDGDGNSGELDADGASEGREGLKTFHWKITAGASEKLLCQEFLQYPCVALYLNLRSDVGKRGAASGASGGNVCKVEVSTPYSTDGPTVSYHVMLSRSELLRAPWITGSAAKGSEPAEAERTSEVVEAFQSLCDSCFGERKGWKALPGQMPTPYMVGFDQVNIDGE